MSPRNSASAVINLLEKTGSHRIVTNDHVSSLRAEVQAELAAKNYDLQVDSMPGLYDAFPSLRPATNGHAVNGMHKVTPYPPRSTPPPPDERVLYLHSSGSTGFPKPIPLTSKIMLHMAQRRASASALMPLSVSLTRYRSAVHGHRDAPSPVGCDGPADVPRDGLRHGGHNAVHLKRYHRAVRASISRSACVADDR